mmetsp:Transcript_25872/g.40598  ORF Transcript_25872/g.40598 Transcript_25872/m.40598 type:complete len:151 (+) Transcript_25872:92-544(+)
MQENCRNGVLNSQLDKNNDDVPIEQLYLLRTQSIVFPAEYNTYIHIRVRATHNSAAVVTSNAVVEKEELQAYPIDLPSPILLSTSMVLAISSIGSLFELSGGTPKLGFAVTAVITALGLPISVFLIYAAILKGAAETEEADREFNKPRRL